MKKKASDAGLTRATPDLIPLGSGAAKPNMAPRQSSMPSIPIPSIQSSSSSASSTSSHQLQENSSKFQSTQPISVLNTLLSEYQTSKNASPLVHFSIQCLSSLRNSISSLQESENQVFPIILALLYLSKKVSEIFLHEEPRSLLLSLLAPETWMPIAPQKRMRSVVVLACSILHKTYRVSAIWPLDFVTYLLQDSLTDRVWVDDELNKPFVDAILTAFPPLPQSLQPSSNNMSDEIQPAKIVKRYDSPSIKDSINRLVLSVFEKTSNFSGANESLKGILKTMTFLSCYPYVRLRASDRLEEWLNNPNLFKYAKDLLNAIIHFCKESSAEDFGVLSNIMKYKIKLPNQSLVSDIFPNLLKNNPEFPQKALQQFITIELMPTVNQPLKVVNQRMLSQIWNSFPSNSPAEIAFGNILQELIGNDAVKTSLRIILRRTVKLLNHEFDTWAFCALGMLVANNNFYAGPPESKIGKVLQILDLICCAMLVTVPPIYYELQSPQQQQQQQQQQQSQSSIPSQPMSPSDVRKQIARIQNEVVKWMFEGVTRFIPWKNFLVSNFDKMLLHLFFIDPPIAYFGANPEFGMDVEKQSLIKFVVERIPFNEESLIRIIVLAIDQLLLSPTFTLDLLNTLLVRAASTGESEGLIVSNGDVMEGIFKLGWIPNPSPHGVICIASRFWQTCLILMILGAFNPLSIGWKLWKKPTMRYLMESVMMKSVQPYSNPEWLQKERAQREKEQAIEKEMGPTLLQQQQQQQQTQQSQSQSQQQQQQQQQQTTLMIFNLDLPFPRQPPNEFLKKLQTLDNDLRLGLRLCASRSSGADFVLEMIESESGNNNNGVNWLVPIVMNEPEILSTLPPNALVALLCQLPSTSNILPRVTSKIQDVLMSEQAIRILKFLLVDRLAQAKSSHRLVARKSLSLLLGITVENETWLDRLSSASFMTASRKTEILEPSLRTFVKFETKPNELAIVFKYFLSVKEPSISLQNSLAVAEVFQNRLITIQHLLHDQKASLILVEMAISLFRPLISNSKDKIVSMLSTTNSATGIPIVRITKRSKRKEPATDFFAPITVLNASTELFIALCELNLDTKQFSNVIQLFSDLTSVSEIVTNVVDSGNQNSIPLFSKSHSLRIVRTSNVDLIPIGLNILNVLELVDLFASGSFSRESSGLLLKTLDEKFTSSQQINLKPEIVNRCLNQLLNLKSTMPNLKDGSSFMKVLNEIRAVQEIPSARVIQTQKKEENQSMEIDREDVSKQQPQQNWNNKQTLKDVISQFLNNNKSNPSLFSALLFHASSNLISNDAFRQSLYSVLEELLKGETTNLGGLFSLFLLLQAINNKQFSQHPIAKKWNEKILNEQKLKQSKANNSLQLIEHQFVKIVISENGSSSLKVLESIFNGSSLIGCASFDWLNVILPDRWNENLLKLVFGNKNSNMISSQQQFKTYLMALSIHNSSWNSLNFTFDWFFNVKNNMNETLLNSTNVLDWLKAFSNHARSWNVLSYNLASADRRASKCSSREFSEGPVVFLLDFIISDLIQQLNGNQTEEAKNRLVLASPRLKLLKMSLKDSNQNVLAVISHLESSISKQLSLTKVDVDKSNVLNSILHFIYLSFPQSRSFINARKMKSSINLTSKLDLLLHSLITHFTDNQPNVRNAAFIICEKLASLHPNLVLRYSETIASLLVGQNRTLDNDLISLFSHVLTIFECLSPMIFERLDFSKVLDVYFDTLHSYNNSINSTTSSSRRKIPALHVQFFRFLLHFLKQDSKNSRLLPPEYDSIVEECVLLFPELKSFKIALERVNLATSEQFEHGSQLNHDEEGEVSLSVSETDSSSTIRKKLKLESFSSLNSLEFVNSLEKMISSDSNVSPYIILGELIPQLVQLSLTTVDVDLKVRIYRIITQYVSDSHVSQSDRDRVIIELISQFDQDSSLLLEFIPDLFHYSSSSSSTLLDSLFSLCLQRKSFLSQLQSIIIELVALSDHANV